MKKLLFIVITLILSMSAKAQDAVIQLPDSVGKYLFESFINKASIKGSEVLLVEAEYFNPKDMWPALLDRVDEFQLSPQTTKYYNTYYEQSCNRQGRTYAAELYVAMKHEDKIYAFKVDVQWNGKCWQVEKINTDFYAYSEGGEARDGFRNITNDEVLFMDSNPQFNKNFESAVSTLHPRTLPVPESFARKVLSLLSEEVPFGNDEIFLTKQEYMETEGARILGLIDKLLKSGTDLENENEKVMAIKNNPGLLYDEQAYYWGMLPENLKEEFGGDIKDLKIQDIEFRISNWNSEKGIIDTPTISAVISMPLLYRDKNAGLYFSAIWYKGAWKLSHIQGFPYGISSAESVQDESLEDEITIELE